MGRKGTSLTYKLIAFALFLSLVPTGLVAISSLDTFNSMKSTTFDSIDTIQHLAVNESQQAADTAIDRTRKSMIGVMKDNLRSTRDDKIDKYSKILTAVERDADTVAAYTERNWATIDDSEFNPVFEGMVWAGPDNTATKRQQYRGQINKLSHIGVLLEHMDRGNELTSLTYFGTRDNVVVTSKNITETLEGIPDGFSNVERPWYQAVNNSGETEWTNTYVDANTNNLVTTVASPVYQDNELLGVVGFDVTLGVLSNDILETDPGFAFLLDSSGEAIVYPGMKAPNKTVYAQRTFNGTNFLRDDNVSAEMQSLAQAMVDGEEGIREVTIEGERSFVAYGPLGTNDWSVGVAVPVQETMQPIDQLEGNLTEQLGAMAAQIGVNTDEVKASIDNDIRGAVYGYALLIGLLVLAVVASGVYFSRRITDPILELQEKAEAISKGGIGKEVKISTGDEIEELADSFNRVIRTIKILQQRDAPTAEDAVEREAE